MTSITTADEARRVLLRHFHADDGLLSKLRPYQSVSQSDLDESANALHSLIEAAKRRDEMPADVLDVAHALVSLVEALIREPDGLLVRNKLIDASRREMLADWTGTMQTSFERLLGALTDGGYRLTVASSDFDGQY